MHQKKFTLAGMTVTIKSGYFKGEEYRIEDWFDRVTGFSWMFAEGHPACMDYAMRAAVDKLPTDDEVLYGKIGAFGKLVHISEIEEVAR